MPADSAKQALVDDDAIDDIMQRLFELRVELQNSLSDINIELASVRRKVSLVASVRQTFD